MKTIRQIFLLVAIFCLVLLSQQVHSQTEKEHSLEFENPVTQEYLKKNLSKKSPKIILTSQIEKQLKKKIKTDALVQNYYKYLQTEADSILKTPLLKRELEGFRLLFVSRDFLERMTVLCMLYRLEKDSEILDRIDEEVKTICNFSDWNPIHFLDVAEMSLAMAIAVDWVGDDLPKTTTQLAKNSLIEKGLKPSFNDDGTRMFWINGTNNWNSVCHGGMIAAAVATADVNPELSAKTIARALEKLPGSLAEYAPNGVYPEGPTYWGYGTSYALVAANILETALGSDFGISDSPGFMESPTFVLQATAPSGEAFNFADCGSTNRPRNAVIMSWFAAKTGNALFLDREVFEKPDKLGRMAGLGIVWLSQYEKKNTTTLANEWLGKSTNPVAIFRDNENDFYLGAKGGKAHLSHGNMDAGTFVFELNGVRWVVDPGNQRYYLLNKIGFKLSDHSQNGERWTLLTKQNQGHSTITINDEWFDVEATAEIIDFKSGVRPEVTIDLSPLYFNNVASVKRRFVKENNTSLVVEDKIETNENTTDISWGLMTQAEVHPTKDGAVLKQDGKELKLKILEPENISVSIIALDPPPMSIDKTIENFKRIEIRIPAWTLKNGNGVIKVRLSEN